MTGPTAPGPGQPQPEVSIIIVSFNTRDLLRECLASVLRESPGLQVEVLVVDNASADGSADMVLAEFPDVQVIQSAVNLGFGEANNVALRRAAAPLLVLLNSDAFFAPGALSLAVHKMRTQPAVALAGGSLVGRDGSWQPSARSFHTLLGDALVMSGLAYHFPRSRFFGRFDRTWADQSLPSKVDWVPGAFCIIRSEALARIGLFDPAFFLYYEEVDLCLRLHKAGLEVWYWPEIVVTHLGGESSRQLKRLDFSSVAAQVVLWRMRSTLLYYRKHRGAQARLAYWMEKAFYRVRMLRNLRSSLPERQQRVAENRTLLTLMDRAWQETNGGRVSPPRPW